MKKLTITFQNKVKIIIGNEDNEHLIQLNFPKWSTNKAEQLKLNMDKDNLLTVAAACRILELTKG